MHGTMSLNGTWGLTYAEGPMQVSADHFMSDQLVGRDLIEAPVPAPIHQILVRDGWLEDPNYGLNSLKARWVEEAIWIYRHRFTAPAEAANAPCRLVFDKLETAAVIYLNGQEIGRHCNAHRPAAFEVTGKLKEGDNLLIVRLTTGMHENSDKPVSEYNTHDIDLLTRRPFLRKPQYQCGWDWNPRLMNIGILGDVRLEWSDVPRLDQVTVYAVPSDDLSRATVTVRTTVEGVDIEAAEATLSARIVETGAQISETVTVKPCENRFELTMEIDQPELWWPLGHGKQHRYTVEVTLECNKDTQSCTRRTGVRKVVIDQSPHPEEGTYFIININNRPIFCKGGNWVPADLFYSTVTPERYRELIDLAAQANFNMLRIWGGGEFTPHSFCDYCDEIGMLIWHDFLFACAKYPGDDPAFAAEVRREVTWAVRELAHHPSLVVWCGNNEIEWGDWAWGYDDLARTHPHYAMFHHDIPRIVCRENPSTPHWLSSPFSPGYDKEPNDPTVGDQHPWHVAIQVEGGTDGWRYRQCVDRFPNEGGVLGASSVKTIEQFLPPEQRKQLSPAWNHHDNPFAQMDSVPGQLGHAYATVQLWTGRDPLKMDWRDYAFCSGLLQAEVLQEYIINFRRRMFSTSSAIFWMYNDSWPVTHGWTIVDYYLRKKISYHPVRRAFEPITVAAVDLDDTVGIFGINDTPGAFKGTLGHGLFTLDGKRPLDERGEVTLPANSSTQLASFDKKQWQKLGYDQSGAFALLYQGDTLVAQHRLFVERFGNMKFAPAEIKMQRDGGRLSVESPVFAWAVCLDPDGEKPLADDCFDLIPGVPYTLDWPEALGEPKIARTGSRDAVDGK